ncbi:MAG: sigma-54-dependent Fis family transcriptional regulator, partial [Bdellovibrionales bacterium]|nr:sigma-54-dependent Fis family transcriptional regulator [Bdellovibrionales bacterium]
MRVLLVDDEENLLIVLADQLSSKGWDVSSTSNPEEALTLVYEVAPDIVITDLRMEKMNGILLTQKLRSIAPSIPVIVLTAYGEVKTAVEAIKAGAVDYLTKPVNEEELLISLGRACAERAQARENLYLRNEVNSRLGYGSFIGSSDDAQEIRSKIARAALSDAPVVLQGES